MISLRTSCRLTLDDGGFATVEGRPLSLPPKERAVLALLLRCQPCVVSKERFAVAAWGGRPMSDESLARSISRLRRTLEPFGLLIESVYGAGYRLTGNDAPSLKRGTLEAYQHAQQLAQQRTPAGLERAIALLRVLVEQEPAFAPARVALAESLSVAAGWGMLSTPASVDEGLRVLDPLWPPSGEAVPGLQSARGALLDAAWRFDEARQCHEAELSGGVVNADANVLFAYCRHLMLTDRIDEAIQHLRDGLQVFPYAARLRTALSQALSRAGRGAEALIEARTAVVEHPGQPLFVALELALHALLAPVDALEPAARRLVEGTSMAPSGWVVLSYVLARLGRREEAMNIIDHALSSSKSSACEASMYATSLAAIGEFERAVQLLERAYEEHCGTLAMVLRDPAISDWLPRHPKGQRLMRGVFGAGASVPAASMARA